MKSMVGVVKWFCNERKYGFITIDGNDVFVHHTAIQMEGYRTLKKGQEVTCDLIPGRKGEVAVNVRVCA